MKEKIIQFVIKGIKELYNVDITQDLVQLQKTNDRFNEELTIVVFPLKSLIKENPNKIALDLGNYLKSKGIISEYQVVGGFLNMTLPVSAWIHELNKIYADDKYGFKESTENSPQIMIEYSSPNTNKPLHLGHVRNILLGSSLANILEAAGYKVIRTNIVNDRGIHICKSMLAWQKWGNNTTPESEKIKGDHFVGDYYVLFEKHNKELCENDSQLMKEARDMLIKWEQGDPEIRNLWKTMNGWVYSGFSETYKELGITFDKIYYESDTYLVGKKLVLDGLKKGLFYQENDGSVWANLSEEGLSDKLLLRSDGTSVYMTQDIGTAKLRYEDYPNISHMIYVVGNEQDHHFKVLSVLLDKLGFKWGKDLIHFSYGMVELPNGKMKSREGTVVDADDIIKETYERVCSMSNSTDEKNNRLVSLGALKYHMIKIDSKKNMLFDPEESISLSGNTGPFIQYAYVRILSILIKNSNSDMPTKLDESSNITICKEEINLIQKLQEFKELIEQVNLNTSPSIFANYCYELAKEFNVFYSVVNVLSTSDLDLREFRLVLCESVAKVLKLGMGLLGIEMPNKM